MAKITDEQKTANKEASLLKKAAHGYRHRELAEAEDTARSMAEKTSLAREYEAAQDAEVEARNALSEIRAQIGAQITLLEDQMKAVAAEHSPRIEKLNDLRRQAAEKKYAESRRLLEEAQSGFPDMHLSDARWSSSAWVPPKGYVERFAAEHAGDLAQKKMQREKKRVK